MKKMKKLKYHFGYKYHYEKITNDFDIIIPATDCRINGRRFSKGYYQTLDGYFLKKLFFVGRKDCLAFLKYNFDRVGQDSGDKFRFLIHIESLLHSDDIRFTSVYRYYDELIFRSSMAWIENELKYIHRNPRVKAKWKGNTEQLKTLYKRLVEFNFIDVNTSEYDFIQIFNGEIIKDRIYWIEAHSGLVYLFSRLKFGLNLLQEEGHHYDFICSSFCKKCGGDFHKDALHNVMNKINHKMPKKLSIIDDVILEDL